MTLAAYLKKFMKKPKRTKIWFVYTQKGAKISTMTGPNEVAVLERALRLLNKKPGEIYVKDSGKIQTCGTCGKK